MEGERGKERRNKGENEKEKSLSATEVDQHHDLRCLISASKTSNIPWMELSDSLLP